MDLVPGWGAIALRLGLTLAAGALVGWNRGARGHAAGLRTVLLVGLAAAVSMLQATILLQAAGKMAGSFATMDVMRLPLGVLTGVGFIGGGAILKRGDLVVGLTTAATLWAITAVGLCFGGGQLVLGGAVTALTFATLTLLKVLERRAPRQHTARLVVTAAGGMPDPAWAEGLTAQGIGLRLARTESDLDRGRTVLGYTVAWTGPDARDPGPALRAAVGRIPGLLAFSLAFEERS